MDHKSVATVTRVWAHAAKLYLSVVLSGCQPNRAEVQRSVARVLGLLETIESPAHVRSLSWPICVAGCLASRGQEQSFRGVVEDVGDMAEFGTLGTALRIMEAVWGGRGAVDGDSWSVASALSVLGSSALLI